MTKPSPEDDLATNYVRQLRTDLALSQTELAWLLKTHQSGIAAVERGARAVPDRWVDWLMALQRAGPGAVKLVKPCFPSKGFRGNFIAAWRTILVLA